MALNVTVTLMNNESHDVDIINADRIKWDMTAARQRWPKFTDAPFLGMSFLAWAAMKRLGLYNDTWEQFSEHDCLDVEAKDDEAVNPTHPGAEPELQ